MTQPPSRQPSRTLTLRLSPAQYAALTSAARENQLSLAALSRCLVLHGLELLAGGDPAIQRAIRVTRGG